MRDLREELRHFLGGRACVVGIGNAACGDDGIGPLLAGLLKVRCGEALDVVIAGEEPERCLPFLTAGGFDAVLLVDAVDFGGAPGSVVLLDAREIAARFPQVSTHRIGVGVLAKLVEAGGGPRVRLLGVQPGSLRGSDALTPAVRETLDLLLAAFASAVPAGEVAA